MQGPTVYIIWCKMLVNDYWTMVECQSLRKTRFINGMWFVSELTYRWIGCLLLHIYTKFFKWNFKMYVSMEEKVKRVIVMWGILKPNNLICFYIWLMNLLFYFLDCGCVHWIQSDPTMHILPAGRTQEQPPIRRTSSNQTAWNEPHVSTTGLSFCLFIYWITTRRVVI